MKIKKQQNQRGNALIITIMLFVLIATSISIGLAAPTISSVKNSKDAIESKRSYAIAESGVEDVLYRLRTAKKISSTENIVLGNQQSTTIITDISSGKKQINAVGNSNSRNRIINAIVVQGVGASFVYGMQSGQGGINMSNNSFINGSIYSNGSITGSGTVAGSATSANSAALFADQQNGIGISPNNITFGNNNSTQDIAQSFKVTTSEVLSKTQVYIKKISNPSNITIDIVTDSNGSPSTTTLSSGTLSASAVSTNYGWVEVSFSSNPLLVAGTTYWLVLDASTSSTNYYQIGGNNSYTNGQAKIGQYGSTWSNTSPSGLDLFFKIFLGGATGLISGINIGTAGTGNAYANTVNNSSMTGTNYCKNGSGNNKSCNTALDDPVAIDMPITDANISDWKDEGLAGGVSNGNYTVSGTTILSSKKIQGDLTISNGSTLILNGTLWVTGNINIDNNGTIKLSPTYGDSSGIIVTDGIVNVSNNANFQGSGTAGSYVMVLSTSTSTSAITLSNNAGAVLLYAANGTVNVANNAGAKSINGYQINLSNNATITYDSGLANINFSSGPSGSWSATSWREQ